MTLAIVTNFRMWSSRCIGVVFEPSNSGAGGDLIRLVLLFQPARFHRFEVRGPYRAHASVNPKLKPLSSISQETRSSGESSGQAQAKGDRPRPAARRAVTIKENADYEGKRTRTVCLRK